MEARDVFSRNVAEEILLTLEPVMNEITPKWREIGKSLGLSEDELAGFANNNADDEGESLFKVITRWVENSLGTSMWPPLLEAVSSQTTATANVVSDLKEKYSRVVYQYEDDTGEDSDDEEDVTNRRRARCRCCNPLRWCTQIDPAMVILLLLVTAVAIGVEQYLALDKDEIDRYMEEHPLDSDKWLDFSSRPIHILITGKTGTGKSALLNGLIGKEVAKEGGDTLRAQTSEVEAFQRMVNGVPVKVFDSPGLQDGTEREDEYVQDMREKCKEVDLILYTIKMTDERVHTDDVRAMKKLTDEFGTKFWRRAMFVLTFANRVRVPAAPGEHDYEKDYEKFHKKLKLWNHTLPDVLTNKFSVPVDISSNVPVVPAGYHEVPHLPGRRYWFSQFWKSVIDRMTETDENRARFMMEFSKDRWRKALDLSPDDFNKTIDQQNIVKEPERTGWFGW